MSKQNFNSRTNQPRYGDVELYPKYSLGRAVPRPGSTMACLCADRRTYSRKCCEGYLINQGIGTIAAFPPPPQAFRKPDFSNGFL